MNTTESVERSALTQEDRYRLIAAALTYGIDMDETDDAASSLRALGLNEESFFGALYVLRSYLEDPIFAAMQAGDRPIVIRGRAAGGKTSLIVHLMRLYRRTLNANLIRVDCRTFAASVSAKYSATAADTEPLDMRAFIEARVRAQAMQLARQLYPPDDFAILGALLDRFWDDRHRTGRIAFLPSPSIEEGTDRLLNEYDLARRQAASTAGPLARPSTWFQSVLGAGTQPHESLARDLTPRLTLKELTFVTLDPSAGAPGKTLIVLDNMDAVHDNDQRFQIWEWARGQVPDLHNSALLICVTRNETIPPQVRFPDYGAVRFKEFNLDDMLTKLTIDELLNAPSLEEREKIVQSRQLHDFDHNVAHARFEFARIKGGRLDAGRTDDWSAITRVFGFVQSIPRVALAMQSMANWDGRAISNCRLNFARVVVDLVPNDWGSIERLTSRDQICVESLYYCVLTGRISPLPPLPVCAMFDPVEWHYAERDSLPPGDAPIVIKSFRRYLVLAAANTLCLELGASPHPGSVETSELLRVVSSVGLPEDLAQRTILELLSEGGVPCGNLIAPYRWPMSYATIGHNNLPEWLVLTDRGACMLRFLSSRYHYVIGLLKEHKRLAQNIEKVARSQKGLPVSVDLLNEARPRFRELARASISHLREVKSHLWANHKEEWLDYYRRWFSVKYVRTAPADQGAARLLYCERLLHQTGMYYNELARVGVSEAKSFAEEVTSLRDAFTTYVDTKLRQKEEPPPINRPAFLR